MKVTRWVSSFVIVALMAVMTVLPVSAADISLADIESVGEPGEDVKFVSSSGMVETDSGYAMPTTYSGQEFLSFGAAAGCGPFKVLNFDAATGRLYYFNDVGDVDSVWDEDLEEMVPVSEAANGFVSTESVMDALSHVDAMNYFTISTNLSMYTLFFSEGATGIDGLVYACKSSNLAKHVVDPGDKATGKTDNTVTIELVEQVKTGETITGAVYKCSYNLEGFDQGGKHFDEEARLLFVEDLGNTVVCTGSKGSVEFTLTSLENKVYNAYIFSSNGKHYETTFEIDFAPPYNPQKLEASLEEPIVTFAGLDESETGRKTPLYLTIQTLNVPTKMMFDSNLVNTIYATSAEVILRQNGTYKYSAISEMGKLVEGEIEIKCFDPNGVSFDDPGYGELLVDDSGLYQTGLETTESASKAPVVFFSLGAVLMLAGGIVLVRRKGGKV